MLGNRDIQTSVRDFVGVEGIVAIGIEEEEDVGSFAGVVVVVVVVLLLLLLLLKSDARTPGSLDALVSMKSDVCSLVTKVRPCMLACLNTQQCRSMDARRRTSKTGCWISTYPKEFSIHSLEIIYIYELIMQSRYRSLLVRSPCDMVRMAERSVRK